MKICYIDEAGCTGKLPSPRSDIQPVFVLSAVVFDSESIPEVTRDFLGLKKKFFPNLVSPDSGFLSYVLPEIKGSEIRKAVREKNRNNRRHAIGFLDKYINLLENFGAKIFSKIYIKGIGSSINGRSIYTSSIQSMCSCFQNLLDFESKRGVVIIDSRNKLKNATVSYSIFTQKFKTTGDTYCSLLEMPTFGHSENHVGLQMADLLCSALLFPMSSWVYCNGHVHNVHVHGRYQQLVDRYSSRLKKVQHRYMEDGRWRGGVTISDALEKRSGALLFASADGHAAQIS